MANTYSQISIQIVFAVKGRENLLRKEFRPELFKYIAGIIEGKGQTILAVNGWQDHVHAFFGMEPSACLADLVSAIKSNSSKWINEKGFLKNKFQWQEGYGAFSYSRSQRDTVIKYIVNQEGHHSRKTFREEYLDMLRKAEIIFDDKYIFEFYE